MADAPSVGNFTFGFYPRWEDNPVCLYYLAGKTGWTTPTWNGYGTATWDGKNQPGGHIHSYTGAVAPPTCTSRGYTTYTCFCGDSYEDSYVDALGHNVGAWTQTVAPTCTVQGSQSGTCSRCGVAQTREIAALGHDVGSWTQTVAPTCAAQGSESGFCSRCGAAQTREIAALSHTPVEDAAVAPTCTETGLAAGSHCAVCNAVLTAQETVATLGHEWDKGTITTAPTYTTEGVKTYTCTRCKQTKTEAIAKITSSFTDVDDGAYYANAVNWAVADGVTNGVSDTKFAPEATCTRGQIVTFLWRAAGKPTPSSTNNPFTDVKSSEFYYDAVLWAVEKSITAGTSSTKFSPNAGCTRGQVATFLWRYEQQPAAADVNPFRDVKKAEYYYNAVLWAVANSITNGMSATTFAPNTTCTRGQIVTFLFRDINK